MKRRALPLELPTVDVTIVVPVYDEASSLEDVIDRCLRASADLPMTSRILLLDDGSADWSDGLETRLIDRERVDLFRFHPNAGKGAVLNRAFPALRSRYVVVIDADGEYAPEEIDRVLLPLHAGTADWVMGSRYGFGRPRPRQYLATSWVNRAINRWFQLLSGLRFQDLLTGLYACRASCIERIVLNERRFSYTAELIWRVLQRGDVRWCEVPVSYRFRSYADGKKIRWWETLTILAAIWRYRRLPSTGKA